MNHVDRVAQAISDVAVAALCEPPGGPLVPSALHELVRTFGADAAGYYVHEWRGWTTALAIAPDDVWPRVPNARMPTAQAAALHPGIRHSVAHPGAAGPFALTDLVSERAWLSSELGSLMRPDWGRNYQLAIPVPILPGARESRVWVLGRLDRDFTPHDRAVATALAPLLGAISRHELWRELRLVSRARLLPALTDRESLVLHLLDDGLSPAGIAARLLVSPRTVHKHLERAYRKLDAHDRTSALTAARERSLLLTSGA
ncbi:helix-turn-helix transcriptional regulator [Segeticoccus rhizosphaerae]|jgi:DNA-binding CsgD family transcriptional regulator|uniref:helix-turn-helix transcriptional regulator n=1 Tax=Segeticoccus rhizosphaerae TaxID=1104777 RepID=UPI0013906BB4|nr:helix-turn-helix transcriptional regulator [Ornithinicoccus soli]